MNRRLALLAAAGATGAFLFAGPLSALPKGTEDYNQNADTVVIACENTDDSMSYAAPPALWPPNHKYYEDIVITATAKDGDDSIVMTTTGTHNQYDEDTEINGTGNTGDDVRPADGAFNDEDDEDDDGNVEFIATQNGSGTASETWWARAERSGHKSTAAHMGRDYTFKLNATFDGTACFTQPKTFTVAVPHDMRKSNR